MLSFTGTGGSGEKMKPAEKAVGHREYWLGQMLAIAGPVLQNGSRRQLKAAMPVEIRKGASQRTSSHLEAVGRLLSGMAPWIELELTDQTEASRQAEIRKLAIETIRSVVDPASPDYLFARMEPQMLVDAAFLAHAFVRSPRQLWQGLSAQTRDRVVDCLVATREVIPYYSNWLLFSAMIEAFFLQNKLPFDIMRLDLPLKKHEEWYLGDGIYGDGAEFHWDYYNSYVIQPMLMDIAEIMVANEKLESRERDQIAGRFSRYAAIQERLVSPEGTFPPIGRSIAYRTGAFQHLAQAALQGRLPAGLQPAQVRCALTAVMKRILSAPGTFDPNGWLQIGLFGHQNSLGEFYISTGSLYLCSTVFLPLGLPATHEFWSSPDCLWTAAQIWNGTDWPNDHAL